MNKLCLLGAAALIATAFLPEHRVRRRSASSSSPVKIAAAHRALAY
jgi:hypothetical protein